MSLEFTGTVPPQSIRTYVVYDRKSGVIAHVHHVVTFAGAATTSPADDESRALEVAVAHGAKSGKLAVLPVESYDARRQMMVDVRKARLVEVKVPLRRARGKTARAAKKPAARKRK